MVHINGSLACIPRPQAMEAPSHDKVELSAALKIVAGLHAKAKSCKETRGELDFEVGYAQEVRKQAADISKKWMDRA